MLSPCVFGAIMFALTIIVSLQQLLDDEDNDGNDDDDNGVLIDSMSFPSLNHIELPHIKCKCCINHATLPQLLYLYCILTRMLKRDIFSVPSTYL